MVGMARKHVIFHVGLPKTGTSAFQDALVLNRDALRACGIAFSRKQDVGSDFRSAARDTVRYGPSRLRQMRLDRAGRRIRDWADAQKSSVVLITDENLLGWRVRDMYRMTFDRGPAQAMRALQKAFDGDEISWVLFRRDPAAHMQSSYRYAVKLRGVSAEYDDWARETGRPEALGLLVAEAVKAFGVAGHVFDMEEQIASPRSWGAPILELAGMCPEDIDALKPAPRTNAGVPDGLLEYVRRINAIGLEKEQRLKAVDVLLTMHSDLTDGVSRASYGRVE